MSQQFKAAPTFTEDSSDEYDIFFSDDSLGEIDRREAFQKSKQPPRTRSSARKLPPGVMELSSRSFRYVSKRHLMIDDHDDVPDVDDTESSDLSYPEDDLAYEQIQVADGVYMRLRGSQETQKAWDKGECIQTICFVCDVKLACVPDCDGVICPLCRLVSPVDYVPRAAGFGPSRVGGVGLGIKLY